MFYSYYANDSFVRREQVIKFYLSSEKEGLHKETTSKHVRVNAARGNSIFQVSCASAPCRLCTYNIDCCELFVRGNYSNCVSVGGTTQFEEQCYK